MHKDLEEGSDPLAVGPHKSLQTGARPTAAKSVPTPSAAPETRAVSATIAQAMSAANSSATTSSSSSSSSSAAAAAAAAAAAVAASPNLQRAHSNDNHHRHGSSPNNSVTNAPSPARQHPRHLSGSTSSRESTPQQIPQPPHSRPPLPTRVRQAMRAGGNSQSTSSRTMAGADDPAFSSLVARALAHCSRAPLSPSTTSVNATTGAPASSRRMPTTAPIMSSSSSATSATGPAPSSTATTSFSGPVPHPSSTSRANPARHQQHQHQHQHQSQSQQQQHQEASNTMVAKFVLNMWLADKLSPNSLPLLREACLHVLQHVCKEHTLPSGSNIKREAEQRLQFFDANSLKAAATGELGRGHPNHGHQMTNHQADVSASPAASSLAHSQGPEANKPRFSSSLALSASTAASAPPSAKQGPRAPAQDPPLTSSLVHLGQHGSKQQQQRVPSSLPGPAATTVSGSSRHNGGGGGTQQRHPSIFSQLQRQQPSPFSASAFPDTTLTDALNFQGDLDSLADTSTLGTSGLDLPVPSANNAVHGGSGTAVTAASTTAPTSATDLNFLLPPTTMRMAQPEYLGMERWTDTESLGMGLIPDVSDLLLDGVLGFDNDPFSRTPCVGSDLPLSHQQQLHQQQQQQKQEPPSASSSTHPPYMQAQLAQQQQQSAQLGSNDDDDKPAKRPKVICPVCAGPGRDTASKVCGLCYNGVYNDIKKYLKREQHLNPAVLVDVERFIHELQVMPRGCEKDYTCTQADYAFDLPQYEKCTRCRSLAVSHAAPELVTQMIRKGLDKERRRREKEATALS